MYVLLITRPRLSNFLQSLDIDQYESYRECKRQSGRKYDSSPQGHLTRQTWETGKIHLVKYYQTNYRKRHPERIKLRHRLLNAKPDRIFYNLNWRLSHLKQRRDSRAKCEEKRRENGKQKESNDRYRATEKYQLNAAISRMNNAVTCTLSKNDIYSLVKSPCFYCDTLCPANECHSIDRIDSNEGYTKENAIGACATCNFMKNNHNVFNFLQLCANVTVHFIDYTEESFPDINFCNLQADYSIPCPGSNNFSNYKQSARTRQVPAA